MFKTLARAIFRDFGFSKKSAEMRSDLLVKMLECERRGIDPIAEFSKRLQAVSFEIRLPAVVSPLD